MGKAKEATPQTAEDTPAIVLSDAQKIFVKLRDYEFPDAAMQEKADKNRGKITGYKFNWLCNAMSEVVGIENWEESGEVVEVLQGSSSWVVIYKSTITVQLPGDRSKRVSAFGGSRNIDKWEAYKGAQTNAIKKALSYLGLGWKAYTGQTDEDFTTVHDDAPTASTPSALKLPTPAVKAPTAVATPKATLAIPPAPTGAPVGATGSIARPSQKEIIRSLFLQLGYTSEQVGERIKALEVKSGFTWDTMTAAQAHETIEKMRASIANRERSVEASVPESYQQTLVS